MNGKKSRMLRKASISRKHHRRLKREYNRMSLQERREAPADVAIMLAKRMENSDG